MNLTPSPYRENASVQEKDYVFEIIWKDASREISRFTNTLEVIEDLESHLKMQGFTGVFRFRGKTGDIYFINMESVLVIRYK